jgi:hypothetical protein
MSSTGDVYRLASGFVAWLDSWDVNPVLCVARQRPLATGYGLPPNLGMHRFGSSHAE